jgi:hypothetical protein
MLNEGCRRGIRRHERQDDRRGGRDEAAQTQGLPTHVRPPIQGVVASERELLGRDTPVVSEHPGLALETTGRPLKDPARPGPSSLEATQSGSTGRRTGDNSGGCIAAGERRESARRQLHAGGCALFASSLFFAGISTKGHGVTNSPTELLASGALVWLGNNVAFALLYWLMDAGGPIARSRSPEVLVDFAFTQQLSPEVAPGWRPVFLDYLHLGFTNATAFSPTDVMPLTHRAKYTMLVQSTVALALFGLIVARAVNAFT